MPSTTAPTASPTSSQAPTSPTLSQTTLVDDNMSETTAASHDDTSASAASASSSSSGLSMLELLAISARSGASTAQQRPQQASHASHRTPRGHQHGSHGSHAHSHTGHGGECCSDCGGNHNDVTLMPRTFSDKVIFDWAVIMGGTHPDKYTVSLGGTSAPSSDFAAAGSSNQSRAQRYHEQTASRTPAQTKAALAGMGKAISYGEDELVGMDWAMGRVNNVHYKLPITGSKGKPVFAAISMDFLPYRPREASIGRPAVFPQRLWRFSRAFWQDYFPSPEATAASAHIETSTKQYDLSGASRKEGFGTQQGNPLDLVYVPAAFSGFDFPCLYSESSGLCWPLIDISKQKEKGVPFLPWQNKRKGTKYFAFAPCPVDPFDLGPPLNPLVSIQQGQHPVRVERLITSRGEKASAFVDGLEKVDTPLQQRASRVGIGQVTLANKEKLPGCADCYKPFTGNDQVVAAPCGAYHLLHASCLKDHFETLDLLQYLSCCQATLVNSYGYRVVTAESVCHVAK